jgi:hypothetical protein
MKSWELTNGVLRTFYPALVPGIGHIVHQDFAHVHTPWIHLTHYRVRDAFELVYDVPSSSSVVFRLTGRIAPERLSTTYSVEDFSAREIDAAFEHSLGMVVADKRPAIAAAKVMLFIQRGDVEKAREEMARCRTAGYRNSPDITIAEGRLQGMVPTSSVGRMQVPGAV